MRAYYFPEETKVRFTDPQGRTTSFPATSWHHAERFSQRAADSFCAPVTLIHAHNSMSGIVLHPETSAHSGS